MNPMMKRNFYIPPVTTRGPGAMGRCGSIGPFSDRIG